MNKFLLCILALIIGSSLAFSQNYYLGTGTPSDEVPTSCASCHTAGSTADDTPIYDYWVNTAHATAQDSVSSSHYGYNCLKCHNTGWDPEVDNFGADEYVVLDTNATPNYTITDQENWNRVKNVGCEACHGPLGTENRILSLDHWNFQEINKPDYSAENCGRCHSEAHHPYMEEWSLSAHATSAEQAFIVNNPGCVKCHVAQSFVEYIKDPENYEEEILVTGDEIQPLTCVTCHDPHKKENPGQLWLPLDGERVICDVCHNAEILDTVDVNSTPHHTTSEVLSGTEQFGYQYPGENYPNSAHTFAVVGRCVTCHVNVEEFNPTTGIAAVGHTFEPKISSCATANCHPNYYDVVDTSNASTKFDYKNAQTITDSLMTVLSSKLESASAADSSTESFKQARYNFQAIASEGSRGVHNTKLVHKLLRDAISRFSPTAVEDVDELPTSYSLSQNYPNPFNPSTQIKFSVPNGTHVKITIYDAIGNEITNLVDNYYPMGSYKVNWNASKYASGVYMYRIEAGNFNMVKKMVLLK